MAPVKKQPLLTVAIPTYNRAKYLERCLKYLFDQKEDFDGNLEILISDNCSSDNTASIVKGFQNSGLPIWYIKNENNIGPDLNILQCYEKANGKYILAMGDDDALLIGSIKKIYKIINDNDNIGAIFLNPANIDKISSNYVDKNVTYKVFKNVGSYLYHVSYFITFISANIINREALNNRGTNKWLDSNLTQVPVILNAIKIKGAKNIFVDTKFLAAQADNSGGYNFFKVFGHNFNNILKDVFKENDSYRRIIINDVFIRFFPFWIIKLKKGDHSFVSNDTNELTNMIGYNFYFWLLSYPILKLPAPLDKAMHFCVRVFGYIRKKTILKVVGKLKVRF